MIYEKAASLGLGYLLYKGLMAQLAQEAVTTSSNKEWTGEQAQENAKRMGEAKGWSGMFFKKGTIVTWDSQEDFQKGLDLWASRVGVAPEWKPSEFVLPEGASWGVPVPLEDITFNLGGSLLPEDFELVGPSRTGITRPKGLD
jgi:hypothetical protein